MSEAGKLDIRVEESPEVKVRHAAKTAATVAASTVVATSLVGALSEPPRTDLMSLPEPTPIVQQYVVEEDVIPEEIPEDTARTERWRRLLKILRYLLLAVMLAATLLFGALKGCAGVAGGLLPSDDARQEQTSPGHAQATEDERGVAVAG